MLRWVKLGYRLGSSCRSLIEYEWEVVLLAYWTFGGSWQAQIYIRSVSQCLIGRWLNNRVPVEQPTAYLIVRFTNKSITLHKNILSNVIIMVWRKDDCLAYFFFYEVLARIFRFQFVIIVESHLSYICWKTNIFKSSSVFIVEKRKKNNGSAEIWRHQSGFVYAVTR